MGRQICQRCHYNAFSKRINFNAFMISNQLPTLTIFLLFFISPKWSHWFNFFFCCELNKIKWKIVQPHSKEKMFYSYRRWRISGLTVNTSARCSYSYVDTQAAMGHMYRCIVNGRHSTTYVVAFMHGGAIGRKELENVEHLNEIYVKIKTQH